MRSRWSRRRRAGLFAADLETLGGSPEPAAPRLATLDGTDEALGRLYVLEGSTLGGVFIDRHLAAPARAVRRTAAGLLPLRRRDRRVWHAFRRRSATAWPRAGDAGAVVASARATFAALAAWCRTAG